MSDRECARLERALDVPTRMHAKLNFRPDSPGFTRLDHYSGLFLERGAAEGQWIQPRTWGHPAPQSVHEWHVGAAGAAHQLDPTVTLPQRLCASAPETPNRPLGRAANKRLARIRRHMVGLPSHHLGFATSESLKPDTRLEVWLSRTLLGQRFARWRASFSAHARSA